MRIKSYFDSSVQTAMRQARGEFGDDVMLVTSRVTSPESRHLGDYEVVFAVDEKETGPKPAMPGFEQIFREQLAPAKPAPARLAEAETETPVKRLQAALAEIGLDPSLIKALMTLVQACAPPQASIQATPAPEAPPAVEIIEAAILPEPVEEPLPVMSAETSCEAAMPVQEEEPHQAIVEAVEAPVIHEAPVPYVHRPFLQRTPAPRATSRPPAKSGLMLMVASLGLFAISRRSGR